MSHVRLAAQVQSLLSLEFSLQHGSKVLQNFYHEAMMNGTHDHRMTLYQHMCYGYGQSSEGYVFFSRL